MLVATAHAATGPAVANAADPGSALLDDGGSPLGTNLGGEDLYLEVVLNGTAKGLAHFGYRDGELWASAATLQQLGFALRADTPDPVRLGSLPGLQVTYDSASQQLTLQAPLRLLNLSTTVLNTPRENMPEASSSPGLLLNYDLYSTQTTNGQSTLSGYSELRAFTAAGVLSSTELSRADRGNGHGWRGQSVRLDTAWSRSYPDAMLTLRVGDTLTGYLPWTRATRIAGVQLGRNFALQPYRVTAPLPSFIGSAALPSDVELYVNGIRQYSGKVPAGPFQLNTVPNISGAGNAQVVITDALGRATTLSFPLYAAHNLLQAGLSDWSAEVGVVRRNYGLHSFDYGHEPAGSGTVRYGVSDQLTAEAHAETTAGVANEGLGGSWLLGQAGILSGAVAHSHSHGRDGAQYNLGYSWRNERFNVAVDGTRTRGDYRDMASLYGAPTPQLSARALVGITSATFGSMGASYLHLRYPHQAASRYGSLFWFKSIGHRGSLSLNVNQNLDDSHDRSIFVGFSLALDSRTTLSSTVQRDGSRTSVGLDASHPITSDHGFGWFAGARQGDGLDGGQAELDYRGNYADLRAGVNAIGSDRYGYADASGAVVLMDGHPFAARRIDSGFAVVSTDGIAHVPVTLENRPVGETDRHGLLLVTPLNAYQRNHLGIDPMRLPANVAIQRVKAVATPADRAGTLVSFGIEPIRAASVVLLDAAGKPLPLGSPARLAGQADTGAMVGFDGTVYLDTLADHNTLDVTTPTGPCQVRFDFPKGGTGIPSIGPLTCQKKVSR